MYTPTKERPTEDLDSKLEDLDIQLGRAFKIDEHTIYAVQGTSVTVLTCGCGTGTCYPCTISSQCSAPQQCPQ